DPPGCGVVRKVPGVPGMHDLRRPAVSRDGVSPRRPPARQPGRLVYRPRQGSIPARVGTVGLRGRLRVRRREVQAAAPGGPDFHLRVGTGRARVSRLPEEVHGRVLPAGPGATRYAERQHAELDPGDLPGKPNACREPLLAGGDPRWIRGPGRVDRRTAGI